MCPKVSRPFAHARHRSKSAKLFVECGHLQYWSQNGLVDGLTCVNAYSELLRCLSNDFVGAPTLELFNFSQYPSFDID